jgi:predicted porin
MFVALRRPRLRAACLMSSAIVLVTLATIPARAQAVSDAQIKALQAQIDQLQKTVKQLQAQQARSNAKSESAGVHAPPPGAMVPTAAPPPSMLVKAEPTDSWFFRHKPGSTLTFETPGGEITGYGNIDVSVDGASKNVGTLNLNGATPPVGNFGWMPDISTNLSYVGVRGFQRIPHQDFTFVYQLETGFEVSAAPGTAETGSADHNTVNGALFSRNSFIGFASPAWGAIKIGKTDAPYKTSTAAFNPFSGEWGDYGVIMGNTGGDNRVEFGTRLDHAIWYESPTVNGWQFNALFAPGQNRSWISSNIPAGEVECAGTDTPQSGGDLPVACNDGAFSDAASANLSYTNGGFYATAAAEWHHAVNRQSDITALYGVGTATDSGCSTLATGASQLACQTFFNQDVADEWATKIGALYKFATGTTIGAIAEYMQRDVPADLQFQDERTRWGTWAFLSQQLSPTDSIHFGWAHAFATPGDPGQHNDATLTTVDGAGTFAPNANQADMVTAAYKRELMPGLTWYTDIAAVFNGPSAHYALGAGGRAITTDCHDAFSADGSYDSTPHCYTGTTIVGTSTGLQYRF